MHFINIYAYFWFHICLQCQGMNVCVFVLVGPDSSIASFYCFSLFKSGWYQFTMQHWSHIFLYVQAQKQHFMLFNHCIQPEQDKKPREYLKSIGMTMGENRKSHDEVTVTPHMNEVNVTQRGAGNPSDFSSNLTDLLKKTILRKHFTIKIMFFLGQS